MGSQSNAVLTSSSSSSSSSSIQAYTISIYRPLFKSFTYPSFTGSHGDVFEFDEADVWSSNVVSSLESKKTIPSSRCSKKAPRKIDRKAKDGTPVTCASLPVNIPDWSKIYSDHPKKENIEGSVYPVDDDTDYDEDEDDHDDDQDGRVPPHEYLARRRGASFSVHEGIGRTLKGRDLRQVRNAIWKRVGFED